MKASCWHWPLPLLRTEVVKLCSLEPSPAPTPTHRGMGPECTGLCHLLSPKSWQLISKFHSLCITLPCLPGYYKHRLTARVKWPRWGDVGDPATSLPRAWSRTWWSLTSCSSSGLGRSPASACQQAGPPSGLLLAKLLSLEAVISLTALCL